MRSSISNSFWDVAIQVLLFLIMSIFCRSKRYYQQTKRIKFHPRHRRVEILFPALGIDALFLYMDFDPSFFLNSPIRFRTLYEHPTIYKYRIWIGYIMIMMMRIWISFTRQWSQRAGSSDDKKDKWRNMMGMTLECRFALPLSCR